MLYDHQADTKDAESNQVIKQLKFLYVYILYSEAVYGYFIIVTVIQQRGIEGFRI